jgi:hypothetical protein
MMRTLGGRDPNDVVARCLGSVIQRPQLAQHFNCGGHSKAGTVLDHPTEKENFMGTHTQKILLRMYQNIF